jgi:hypothetical protein
VTFSNFAKSALSDDERYFLFSNIFSSSKICLPVNVVRTFFVFLPPEPSAESSPDGVGVVVESRSARFRFWPPPDFFGEFESENRTTGCQTYRICHWLELPVMNLLFIGDYIELRLTMRRRGR